MTTTAPRGGTGDDLTALYGQINTLLTAAFATVAWAEDEIARAAARDPESADMLYHAFVLLQPRDIGPGMGTEFVYRGHVRELLDRLAAGADTRPATAAEIGLACAEIGQRAPMHAAAAGLYFRMWLHAFPDHPVSDSQPDEQIHYERLYGERIDELEAVMRRKLADPTRRLGNITCTGRHDGQAATCRYTSHGAS